MQAISTRKKSRLAPGVDDATLVELSLRALEVRKLLLELGLKTGVRLHYGAIFSSVEILTFLYFHWLRVNPRVPLAPDRDRFILSKGHAAPGLYAVLALAGFFSPTEFESFRVIGSNLQGHPDRHKTPGVDCSTGSLGQGFPVACGMALAAQIDRSQWKVYSCISDGECNEGSVWEAALTAANLHLDHHVVLVDVNGKSSYGPMAGRNSVEPLEEKWKAFGWDVFSADGHDFVSLSQALTKAEAVVGKPAVVLCHTVKGKGIPWAEKNHTKSNYKLEDSFAMEALDALASQKREICHGCA